MQETWVRSLGWEDALEEEMAAHSSILAWEIPRTEETGELQFMGSQESDTTNTLYPPLWDKEVSFPCTGSNMLIYFL